MLRVVGGEGGKRKGYEKDQWSYLHATPRGI